MDLTEFLLARIAEDEAWEAEHPHFSDGTAPDDWVPPWWTRVLAECDAKRRIVAEHSVRHICVLTLAGEVWEMDFADPTECETLCILALPYADHEDFQEEWKL